MSGRKSQKEKESRWDIIRKKHINCINVTTETVRKFLNLDFVDEKSLIGKGKRRRLDPVIVMDLRHEMIKRKPKEEILSANKKFPSNFETPQGKPETTSTRQRSDCELSIIEKELERFKSEIQRITPRVPQKICKKKNKRNKRSILIKLNNSGIFESLSDVGDKTKDFLETAKSAAEDMSTINSLEEEKIADKNEEGDNSKNHQTPSNSVRFVDDIEVITFSREASIMTELEDEDYEDEITSLIEDEADFFGLNNRQEDDLQKYLNYSEKTITKTTTTTYQQFRYLSNDAFLQASQNPSSSNSTTDEADSTESSELNYYQMFNDSAEEDKESKEGKDNDSFNNIAASLSIKSCHATEESHPLKDSQTDPDLVQEIIRVKTVANVENRHRILRKYLMKWMHYTTIQKITKDSNLTTKSERMTKIDAYLKKIREHKKVTKKEDKSNGTAGKAPNASRDNAVILVKRYQSKLKLQQDIIEVQKMKLERQERMIAELRLSRLDEDAKKFKQDLREELRNAMRTGDVRLRAKAKCLQMVNGDVVEEQESKFVAYGNMIPKFLAKMQERALERQVRHEQAKERRLTLEQEKDAQKHAFEEDKRKADEEAKRQRMLELQEKRRREKLEKIRKEQERERHLENVRKANAFYRSYLLRRFGLDRLKKAVRRKRNLELKVTNLRKRLKVKACFKAWISYTRTVWTLKFDKAQDYYELYLQRICVRVWKENLQLARGQMMVAVDWHEMKLNEKFFGQWLAKAREAKLAEEIKMKHAETHHKWHVMWRMLEHWQRLHSVLKLEKETELRRERWRHKIWELIPDYTPGTTD